METTNLNRIMVNSLNQYIHDLDDISVTLDYADRNLDISTEEHRIALEVIIKAYNAAMMNSIKN